MSQPTNTIVPSLWKNPLATGFTVTSSTLAKVLLEPQVGSAAAGTTPALYGGATILDLSISSTDAVAKSMLIWVGTIGTTQDATDTGSITLTAQNTLTRATTSPESFITDGWRVGDQIMVFAPESAAQVAAGIDGIAGTITGVTAAALTVNGTPWAAGTNVLTAGSRLVNVSQLMRVPVPANSGNSDTINQVLAISSTVSTAQLPQELKLDASSMLIGSMVAAVSALPAVVSASVRAARY